MPITRLELEKSIQHDVNYQLLASKIVEWDKKKRAPIFLKMAKALKENYIHTVSLEQDALSTERIIEAYRLDKLRAVARAKRAEEKCAELEEELKKYKMLYGE